MCLRINEYMEKYICAYFKNIYRLNPNHISNKFIPVHLLQMRTGSMKISTVGTKARTAGCAHSMCLMTSNPPYCYSKSRQVEPDNSIPAKWRMEKHLPGAGAMATLQSCSLWPSNPLLLEALEELFRKAYDGDRGTWGCEGLMTWAWAGISMKKMKASVWVWSSPQLVAREDECEIITVCHLAINLGQI